MELPVAAPARDHHTIDQYAIDQYAVDEQFPAGQRHPAGQGHPTGDHYFRDDPGPVDQHTYIDEATIEAPTIEVAEIEATAFEVAAAGARILEHPGDGPPGHAAVLARAALPPRPWRAATAAVWQDQVLRRLTALALLTNLLVQAGAVLAVSAWQRSMPDSSLPPGFLGAVFLVGAAGVSLVVNAHSVAAGWFTTAAGGFLTGGTALLVSRGLDPALLVLVGATFFAGAALSSVVPIAQIIVSQRVDSRLRDRVGTLLSVACLLGVPLATAFAVWAGARGLSSAVGTAAACYLAGMLVPVLAYRGARRPGRPGGARPRQPTAPESPTPPARPASSAPAARSASAGPRPIPASAGPASIEPVSIEPAIARPVPAVPAVRAVPGSGAVPPRAHQPAGRVDITLSYSDGQWQVDVRRGRTVLATGQPVPAAQAMRILSLLDIPAAHDGVEQALDHDRAQAYHRLERIRSELAAMEAKLEGIPDTRVLPGVSVQAVRTHPTARLRHPPS